MDIQSNPSDSFNVDDHSPRLFIIDDQNPEDIAMAQALYSRSPQSIIEHLERVKKSGSGKFMANFYIGYGHESIGDCGSTTIFLERVSILAAKSVQDWSLYNGQETSTRYIDMGKQGFDNPLKTSESRSVLEDWRNFYLKAQEPLTAHLKAQFPKKEKESQTIYNKAIAARCFDILRAFLPAGIHTQLAWHTNLRQAANKLALMNHHPDPIIRKLSQQLHAELKEKYKHSFGHKLYEKTEVFRELIGQSYTYHDNKHPELVSNYDAQKVGCVTKITPEELDLYRDLIVGRPPKTELPAFLLDLGMVTFNFLLDFGSFRDIQRHRNGVCRMPLLTSEYGFESWYLNELPNDLRNEAEELIARQVERIEKLTSDPIAKQYYLPLGFRVACQVTYGLPAAVYTIELRSGTTVHATLRKVAHQMKDALQQKLPNLLFHVDTNPDEWDIRRGEQDIVLRN